MKKLLTVVLIVLVGLFTVASAARKPLTPTRDRAADLPSELSAFAVGGMTGKLTITTANPVCGKNVNLHVDVTGGSAPFTYEYYVVLREDYMAGRTTVFSQSNSPEFNVTLVVPGTYLTMVRVIDRHGNVANVSGRSFTLAETAQYPSLQSVVNRIAAQCMSARTGDYERALWLHDYLIYHAYFDESYTYYGPDGVLVRGTGTCDSYRYAMDMLLNAVGIRAGCVIGIDHAWNIALLDGEWYMIDPTWDDPIGGGKGAVSGAEHHAYFGITTEMLKQDHTILYYEKYSNNCNSLADNYAVRSGLAMRWASNAPAANTVALYDQVADGVKQGLDSFSLNPGSYVAENGARYDANVEWYLTWPAVAWVLNEQTWEVDGEPCVAEIVCDIPARSIYVSSVSEAPVPCEHVDTVAYTDLGDGTHSMVCLNCEEDLGVEAHHQSCLETACPCGSTETEAAHQLAVTDHGNGTHSAVCELCEQVLESEAAHYAWCQGDAVCVVCGHEGDVEIRHEHMTYVSLNDSMHAYACADCGEAMSRGWHKAVCSGGAMNKCAFCGENHVLGVEHDLVDDACTRCGYEISQVWLPGKLKRIEDEAFVGDHLLKVTVPGACEYIGSRAFANTGLNVITVPDSVQYIAEDAFAGCSSLYMVCSEGSYAYQFAQAHGILVIDSL